jgi:peptide/nickel transport system substrate-binding protein
LFDRHEEKTTMSQKRLTRREFIRLTTLTGVGAVLAACAPATTTPTQAPAATAAPTKAAATSAPATSAPAATTAPTKVAATAVPTAKFNEAPALADVVKAGKLPSVDKRLPDSPMVVKADAVGTYGGTWRMAMPGPNMDGGTPQKAFDYENLVRWDANWANILPNLAEKYEVSADATEFTFHLRKGVKWSDGEPFTVDDILLWREVCADTEITPVITPTYTRGGKLPTVTKVDDTTVKFKYDTAYGLFIQVLATTDAGAITHMSSKFAKQYLPKYSDRTKLEADAKAAGYATLRDYFNNRVGQPVYAGGSMYSVAGRPTLAPWVIEKNWVTNGTQVTFARNPYYWKVDQAGNQYPYFDSVSANVIPDLSAMALKAANGEIDYQSRHFATLDNKAMLYDNQKKGGYHFQTLIEGGATKVSINLNLTHKNEAMRKVMQNKDFRIGLSYALNRQDIIDTIFVGQGQPWQAAPRETSAFYVKQLATQYIEYDVKKANEYLDKVLPKKDASGMRTFDDGKPFTFVLEAADSPVKEFPDVANMIAKHWKAVGINVQAKAESRDIFYTRKEANDHDAALGGSEGGINAITDPRSYLPWSTESDFAEGWAYWYNKSKPDLQMEPPAEVKELMNLYDKLAATGSVDDQITIMKQLLQKSADIFMVLGVCTPADSYAVVSDKMQNVPKTLINTFNCPNPAVGNTFTWYYKS